MFGVSRVGDQSHGVSAGTLKCTYEHKQYILSDYTMDKFSERWSTLKIYVSQLSLQKKIIFGIAVVATIELAGYIISKRTARKPLKDKKQPVIHNEKNYSRDKLLTQSSSTHQVESPIYGKQKLLVSKFMEKLSTDPVLRAFYSPESLKEGSQYSRLFEQYITVAMGGPYVLEKEVDLKTQHSNLGVTKEHYDRFVALWRDCERELGVKGKNIWSQYQADIIV